MAGTYRFGETPSVQTVTLAPTPQPPAYYHYAVILGGERVSSISASPSLPLPTVLSLWLDLHKKRGAERTLYSLSRYT